MGTPTVDLGRPCEFGHVGSAGYDIYRSRQYEFVLLYPFEPQKYSIIC